MYLFLLPRTFFLETILFYNVTSNKAERTQWDGGAKGEVGKSKWKKKIRLMNALKASCSNHGNTDG